MDMPMPSGRSREVEVITGVQRRRRWTPLCITLGNGWRGLEHRPRAAGALGHQDDASVCPSGARAQGGGSTETYEERSMTEMKRQYEDEDELIE